MPIVGFITHVKDFSILTPVSRGENEVITTSDRAQSCNLSLLLRVLFSLFCVASSRSTLGIDSSAPLPGGVILRSVSAVADISALLLLEEVSSSRDSIEVLPSSSELIEYRNLQALEYQYKLALK